MLKTTFITLLAALGAAAPAHAAPAHVAASRPSLKDMRLAVQITGIHVVRWHAQDAAYPDPHRQWVQGRGTQTLGFSDRRPVRYLAIAMHGSAGDGRPLAPLALTPMHAPPKMRASVRRKASWRVNDGDGCDREGGCDGDLVVPIHAKPSCPTRKVELTTHLEAAEDPVVDGRYRLSTPFEPIALSGLWANCPPDMEGVTRPLTLAQVPSLAFAGAIRRISHLRRGGELRLEAQRRRGARDGIATKGCPKLEGPGLQECATTSVTVEVRRVR